MEQVYNPDTWEETTPQQKLDNAIKVFKDTCEAQRTRFLKETRQQSLDKAHGDDYAERIELGVGMLTHYVLNVHPDADKFYHPVAVEVPFAIPLTYPDGIPLPPGREAGETLQCVNSPHCGQEHENPAPVTLNGRVDAILEDEVNGGYYIIDWKSATTLITNGEFLQLDDQITSYCAALELILGLDIRGFLYAEIRKDFPKPPQELSRLYKGRKFSTNTTQMTTLEMFVDTVKEKDSEGYNAGFYNEYIKMLEDRPPKFHQRFPVLQGEAKLKNVLKNVAMEAMEMTDPYLFIYPAPTKMNCQNCAFTGPCLGKYNDEDFTYSLETLYGRKTADGN